MNNINKVQYRHRRWFKYYKSVIDLYEMRTIELVLNILREFRILHNNYIRINSWNISSMNRNKFLDYFLNGFALTNVLTEVT